jgi:hypothetical protein
LVSGSVTFSNRLLRLTPTMGAEGPLWQVSPQQVRLEGRASNVIHSCFASTVDSHDGSAGSVSENEHGLNGDFYLAPRYFDLLQQAALSAADLDITVTFAALDGKIGTLMLSIENKTA